MSAVLLVNGTPRAVTIGVTGAQGPPGPAVTPGTAGQFAVTNAAATALTWTSNLLNGTNLVTVNAASTLKQTNGGTIGSPSDANFAVIQPIDPGKSGFGWHVGAALFNSTFDYVSAFGYGAGLGGLATEPTQTLNFEQDFEVTPGNHVMETYFQFTTPSSPGPSVTYRPFFANFDRAAYTGSIVIGDAAKTTSASVLTSGPVNLEGAYVNSTTDYRFDTTVSSGVVTTQKAGASLLLKYDNQVDRLKLDSTGVTILGTPWTLQPDTGQTLTLATNANSSPVVQFKNTNGTHSVSGAYYLDASGNIQSSVAFYASAISLSGAAEMTYLGYGNGTGIDHAFYGGATGTGELARLNGTALRMTTPLIQSATGVSTLTVGTNKSGATLVLQADAAATNQTLASGVTYYGGNSAAAPARIDWTTSTTPAVVSGTSATSLTVGTNKSGATTALTTGALLSALTLDNPSGSLTKFKTTGQFFDHQVSKATNYTIDSAGAGDTQIVVTAACTITLPDPTISAGRRIEIVVAYNAGAGSYTIARHGTEKINNAAADLVCGDSLGSIRFIRCDGTDWYSKAAST